MACAGNHDLWVRKEEKHVTSIGAACPGRLVSLSSPACTSQLQISRLGQQPVVCAAMLPLALQVAMQGCLPELASWPVPVLPASAAQGVEWRRDDLLLRRQAAQAVQAVRQAGRALEARPRGRRLGRAHPVLVPFLVGHRA